MQTAIRKYYLSGMTRAYIIILAVGLLLLAGCSKTDTAVFSLDYQGRHYVADSSSATAGSYTRIVAYSGVTAISIDGGGQLSTGSYTLHGRNSLMQPFLFYVVVANYVYSQSGTVVVSSYDNTKMSGSFSATLTDGTTISGSFANVPLR
jgi:hypothetical protein